MAIKYRIQKSNMGRYRIQFTLGWWDGWTAYWNTYNTKIEALDAIDRYTQYDNRKNATWTTEEDS